MTLVLLLFFSPVLCALASGASIDRYESEKPVQTTVIHLLRTSEALNNKRPTEENKPEDHRPEEEGEYYYDDEYEYMSGDAEMPQGNSEVAAM